MDLYPEQITNKFLHEILEYLAKKLGARAQSSDTNLNENLARIQVMCAHNI